MFTETVDGVKYSHKLKFYLKLPQQLECLGPTVELGQHIGDWQHATPDTRFGGDKHQTRRTGLTRPELTLYPMQGTVKGERKPIQDSYENIPQTEAACFKFMMRNIGRIMKPDLIYKQPHNAMVAQWARGIKNSLIVIAPHKWPHQKGDVKEGDDLLLVYGVNSRTRKISALRMNVKTTWDYVLEKLTLASHPIDVVALYHGKKVGRGKPRLPKGVSPSVKKSWSKKVSSRRLGVSMPDADADALLEERLAAEKAKQAKAEAKREAAKAKREAAKAAKAAREAAVEEEEEEEEEEEAGVGAGGGGEGEGDGGEGDEGAEEGAEAAESDDDDVYNGVPDYDADNGPPEEEGGEEAADAVATAAATAATAAAAAAAAAVAGEREAAEKLAADLARVAKQAAAAAKKVLKGGFPKRIDEIGDKELIIVTRRMHRTDGCVTRFPDRSWSVQKSDYPQSGDMEWLRRMLLLMDPPQPDPVQVTTGLGEVPTAEVDAMAVEEDGAEEEMEEEEEGAEEEEEEEEGEGGEMEEESEESESEEGESEGLADLQQQFIRRSNRGSGFEPLDSLYGIEVAHKLDSKTPTASVSGVPMPLCKTNFTTLGDEGIAASVKLPKEWGVLDLTRLIPAKDPKAWEIGRKDRATYKRGLRVVRHDARLASIQEGVDEREALVAASADAVLTAGVFKVLNGIVYPGGVQQTTRLKTLTSADYDVVAIQPRGKADQQAFFFLRADGEVKAFTGVKQVHIKALKNEAANLVNFHRVTSDGESLYFSYDMQQPGDTSLNHLQSFGILSVQQGRGREVDSTLTVGGEVIFMSAADTESDRASTVEPTPPVDESADSAVSPPFSDVEILRYEGNQVLDDADAMRGEEEGGDEGDEGGEEAGASTGKRSRKERTEAGNKRKKEGTGGKKRQWLAAGGLVDTGGRPPVFRLLRWLQTSVKLSSTASNSMLVELQQVDVLGNDVGGRFIRHFKGDVYVEPPKPEKTDKRDQLRVGCFIAVRKFNKDNSITTKLSYTNDFELHFPTTREHFRDHVTKLTLRGINQDDLRLTVHASGQLVVGDNTIQCFADADMQLYTRAQQGKRLELNFDPGAVIVVTSSSVYNETPGAGGS